MRDNMKFLRLFDTIMLGIIIAFLLFYIGRPSLVFSPGWTPVKQADNSYIFRENQVEPPWPDKLLAFCIMFLLIKYLHENVISESHFASLYAWIETASTRVKKKVWPLYLCRILVPVVAFIFICFVIWLPEGYSGNKMHAHQHLAALVSFIAAYSVLFLLPDLIHKKFIEKYEKLKAEEEKKPADERNMEHYQVSNLVLLKKTVINWVYISFAFIIIAVLWLLLANFIKQLENKTFCNVFAGIIMVVQTLLDYRINTPFYAG